MNNPRSKTSGSSVLSGSRAVAMVAGICLAACGVGCSSDEPATPVDTTDTGPDTAADGGSDTESPSCTAAVQTPATLRIAIDGTRILDADGRQLLLRGVNAGGRAKLPPFFAFPFKEAGTGELPFAEAAGLYADRVHGWGMNVVRLPFTWEAVEPTRGTWDETFLSRYETLVEAFGARGIRVIVDFHQDVFARPFCGDGFPLWAILVDYDAEAPVSYECHQWFNGYTNPGPVQLAYDAFWANTPIEPGGPGLIDAFEAFWTHVAGRLWQHDAVIGFEIINEPGWGTADPAEFQKQVLTPFYTAMIGVIREAAPGAPVFFDSSGVDAVSASTALDLPEGGDLIFAPHYYDATVILAGRWTNTGADYDSIIGNWREQGDAWNVPVLLGEFGIRREAEGAEAYVSKNFAALDHNLMHGTVWEYSTTQDDWNDEGMSLVGPDGVDGPTARGAARAYPAAVSGTLTSVHYDAESRRGTVVFEAVPGVTEIALPAGTFPTGAAVTVTGANSTDVSAPQPNFACTSWDAEAGRLAIRTTAAGATTLTFEAN